MNFKLVSKNNVGSAFLLLVIILLPQARTFDYFINNYLGRLLLIIAIIVLSYINKILGVVLVLFIIMMLNRIDILYLEGMDNNTKPADTTTSNNQTDAKAGPAPTKTASTESSTTPANITSQLGSVEGTNTTETEDEIKKGKNSNSIPVDENIKSSENVEAFDTFRVTDNYASV